MPLSDITPSLSISQILKISPRAFLHPSVKSFSYISHNEYHFQSVSQLHRIGVILRSNRTISNIQNILTKINIHRYLCKIPDSSKAERRDEEPPSVHSKTFHCKCRGRWFCAADFPHKILWKACRNSGLNTVYIIGLRVELKYPNHKKNDTKVWFQFTSWKMGITSAKPKNGNQHAMNAPVTMANVLAAFLSRLTSSDTCFFSLEFIGLFFPSPCRPVGDGEGKVYNYKYRGRRILNVLRKMFLISLKCSEMFLEILK